jgi:hypothetical protein
VGLFESNGGVMLETLLRDKMASAPFLPAVDRNDLMVVVVWYIWWERKKATHGEAVQSPIRTAQSISTLALNYSKAKKESTKEVQRWLVEAKRNFC